MSTSTADRLPDTRAQLRAELPRRLAVALPLAAVAIALLAAGGLVFVLGVVAVGAFAAREAYRLLTVILRRRLRAAIAATVLAALLALLWVGAGVVHAILLRGLDHGGGLLLDVLLAVFIGDTAAHLVGSFAGRRPLAPSISPGKTVEGLCAGLVAGPAAAVAASALQPWLSAGEAALIGLAAAAAAPLGDLFESAVKRRAAVKDSGTMLGPHGGVLDRIDAVLFGIPAGYYAALALL